jgi:hypothetical protein
MLSNLNKSNSESDCTSSGLALGDLEPVIAEG